MRFEAIPALLPTILTAVLTITGVTACATTPVTPATPASAPASAPSPRGAPPQPTPVPPVAATLAPRAGSWTFSYAPGTYTYSVSTDAVVATFPDTMQKRQLPQLAQKTTITVSASGEEQVVEPVAVSGMPCDSSTALLARALQLIPKLPSHFSAGDRWRDSTTTSGCRGKIPAEATVISNYQVIGDTVVAGSHAVQIHRADSLSASGEGADGQHRIIIAAMGTGDTNIYFDVTSGRLIASHGLQNTLVNVTASGRTTQFVQRVTEVVALAGTP